jgi:predicted DNA-binding transcriptional regulator AlpA
LGNLKIARYAHMSQQETATELERLLTAREAANFLRVSESWLAKARMQGNGPPFVKIGRSIRYRQSDLLRWMRSRTHLSTGESE